MASVPRKPLGGGEVPSMPTRLARRPEVTNRLTHGQVKVPEVRRTFTGHKVLQVWGAAVCLGYIMFIFLPGSIRGNQIATLGLAGLGLSFALSAFLYMRTTLYLSYLAIMMALLQVWIVVSYLGVAPTLAQDIGVGRHLYWVLLSIIPYLCWYALCALDEAWRERLNKILLGAAVLTSLVALCQFFHVPGFQAQLKLYAVFFQQGVTDDYMKTNADRTTGLGQHAYELSLMCILGIAIAAGGLMYRKLYKWEIAVMILFTVTMVTAQSRTFYLAWAVTIPILVYYVFKRDRRQGLIVVSLIAVGLTAILIFFAKQLEYGIKGPNTLEGRALVNWNAADQAVMQFPLTGMGPNPGIMGNGLVYPSRWNVTYTESGYRLIAVTAGIPGLVILLMTLAGCLWICASVMRNTTLSPPRRAAGFAGLIYILSIVILLYITNVIGVEGLMYPGMFVAAIMTPLARERVRDVRGQFDRLRRAVASSR